MFHSSSRRELENCWAVISSALEFNFAMRKTRKGRQLAQKAKARRIQQMTRLRQKAVRQAALSSAVAAKPREGRPEQH
jgi:hypothetical protein